MRHAPHQTTPFSDSTLDGGPVAIPLHLGAHASAITAANGDDTEQTSLSHPPSKEPHPRTLSTS
ncbi:MAG TPA: hypothetical protein VGO47_03570 [Chlamydiales bacterium]|nr:hypothetical protein [Chlamydiales bacterium]